MIEAAVGDTGSSINLVLFTILLVPVSPDWQRGYTRIVTERKLIREEVGHQAIFPCKVENLGSLVVIWKYGNRVLTAGNMIIKQDTRLSVDQTNLVIRNLSLADEGVYSCEVEVDIDKPLVLKHNLKILEPPLIDMENLETEVKVLKGSTITIRCFASGFPEPQINWERKIGLLPNSGQTGDPSVLTIHNITRHESGDYICIARNGIGNPAKQAVNVIVHYAPEVQAERSQIHTGPGYSLDLSCTVYSSPAASVSWYRNTMLLEPDNNIFFLNKGTMNRMSIKTVDLTHFGNYTCVAANMCGKGETSIFVTGVPTTPAWEKPKKFYMKELELAWTSTSHSPILKYKLQYRELQAKSSSHFHAWIHLTLIADNSSTSTHHRYTYTVEKSWPGARYEAVVQAYNKFGWSETSLPFLDNPVKKVKKTKSVSQSSDDSIDPNPQLILSNSVNSRLNHLFLHFISVLLFGCSII